MTDDNTIDYQLGAHDVDTSGIAFGDTADADEAFVEFDMERQAVFRRLADDIYESDQAGIREPLANAVTAVLQAETDETYDLAPGDGRVEFVLDERGDDPTLHIIDNGIGMGRAKIREVVSVIGRSTVRDDATLAGQFGMGFLALFTLTGMDGSFAMHSRPREDGVDPVDGVWQNSGFEPTEESQRSQFNDFDSGTEFILPIKDATTARNLFTYIKQDAWWARVPVEFTRLTGFETETHSWGCAELGDTLPEDAPSFEIETPYFRAVTAPYRGDGTDAPDWPVGQRPVTLLLDVSIDRHSNTVPFAPWPQNVNIRFHYENPVVVAGPHEGEVVVDDAEYDSMAASRKHQYIPRSALENDDVVLPAPTGTRDTLEANPQFWEWLGKQFWVQYHEHVQDIWSQIETPPNLADLSKTEYKLLEDALSRVDSMDYQRFVQAWEHTFEMSLTDSDAAFLYALQSTVDVAVPASETGGDFAALQRYGATEDRAEITPTEIATYRTNTRVIDILWEMYAEDADADVYIGRRLNDEKAVTVWTDGYANQVLRVPSAKWYDFYAAALEWEPLKTVSVEADAETDSLEEDGEDSEQATTTEAEAAPPTVTLHVGGTQRQQVTLPVSEVADDLWDTDDTADESPPTLTVPGVSGEIRRLIGFPDTDAENVSDHYWLTSQHTAVFRCQHQTWEKLRDLPRVVCGADFLADSRSQPIPTSEGRQPLADVDTSRLVAHILPDDIHHRFADDSMRSRVQEAFERQPWRDMDAQTVALPADDIIYAPLTPEMAQAVQGGLHQATVLVDDAVSYSGAGLTQEAPAPLVVYFAALFPTQYDSPEVLAMFDTLDDANTFSDLDAQAENFITFLQKSMDAGVPLPSQTQTEDGAAQEVSG